MTIMSTRSAELTIQEVVVTAFEVAGLKNEEEELTPAQASKGRRFLKLVLDEWAKRGKVARLVQPTNLTLEAGTEAYALEAGAIGVDGAGQLGAVTLSPMTREQWLIQRETGAEGPPLQYYVDLTGPLVQVHFWPTPDTSVDGETAVLQVEVFRADVSNPAATPDVERFWTSALVWQLAADLAMAAGLVSRSTALDGKAEAKFNQALGAARSPGPTMATLVHRGPYSR